MSEKGYLFLGSIELECPDCSERTNYRRDGYDGELGEGQYCSKCRKYIFEPGMRMISTEQLEKATGFVVNGKKLKIWRKK